MFIKILQAETLLGNTETSLNHSRDILSNISKRLIALEMQIQQKRVDVEEARNLTSITQDLADHVANVSFSSNLHQFNFGLVA